MTHWKRLIKLAALAAIVLLLVNCSGGSSSTTTATTDTGGGSVATAGIDLPTEVSAIPAENGTPAVSSLSASIRLLALTAAELPADSDYVKTVTAKYVDEPTLEVFGIIETILKAMSQTHYADPDNVNAGPYRAIVSWTEPDEGAQAKSLEDWVVDSRMIEENDLDVNLVNLWIEDPEEITKVEGKVYQAPRQDADGDYLNYGKWSIHALFIPKEGQTSGGEFFADADIDADGNTVLRMYENSTLFCFLPQIFQVFLCALSPLRETAFPGFFLAS